MSDPIILLDGVLVTVAGQPILDVPQFTVRAGKSVALVGPNGAGKTTLLHVAALLRTPERGSVCIHGQPARAGNATALRRSLSVVFQDPLLFDVRVLANTAAGAHFQGFSPAEAERRARAWLEHFGVAHLAQRRARTLSGGEAARVALARAFVTDPAILLVDEPFSALDAPTRAELLPALRARLQETGAASVMVTHDLDEAFAFAERIDVMEGGRIIASGNAPALMANPPSRRAAELLGIETILPASVVCAKGRDVLVNIDPDGPTIAVHDEANPALVSGQSATFTLTSSATRIVHSDETLPAHWNRLPGRVQSATPQPSGTKLVIETPAPITAVAPWDMSRVPWAVGERAVVAFSAMSAHLIRESV